MGGGGVENYTTRMFARDKKVHSARFVTKSTNYYFLIQLITGWHLRPIFRLILTGYIFFLYFIYLFSFYRYRTNNIQIETYKHYKIYNNYLNYKKKKKENRINK